MNTHKFGIGEYLTRNGQKAAVAAVREHDAYPLIGWIDEDDDACSWTADGLALVGMEVENDLMPPAPEMVKVRLTMDDIPQGAEFRPIGTKTRFTYKWINAEEVCLNGRGISYQTLMDEYEMRAPGGEWKPCWKEVAK